MISFNVRILPGKTIRLNLATTKTFNADKLDVRKRQHPDRLVEKPIGEKCLIPPINITA
jgi:hypothetical protein